MNRTRVKELLRDGCVWVNDASITRHDHVIKPGDRVRVDRDSTTRKINLLANAGISIVFEDESLVIIDKPAGLLTVATEGEKTDTAFARLRTHFESRRESRPYVVHRLDRETSGLLLFAKQEEYRELLQTNWGLVSKTYLAVVEGSPPDMEGDIESFLLEGRNLKVRTCAEDEPDARWARTRYRVVRRRREMSLVEVDLETGRKHQIRVHFASLGCPIVGDELYGSTLNPVSRLGLHAWRLELDHPVTGMRLQFESPLPAALAKLIR